MPEVRLYTSARMPLVCLCSGLLFSALACTQRIGVWERKGTVLQGTAKEEYSVQEPSLLYDDGAKQFRMWFTCGWIQSPGICYATSPDAIHWSRWDDGTGPAIANLYHAFVFEEQGSGLYYAYGVAPGDPGGGFLRYRSGDGLHWELDAKGILPATGEGWSAEWNGNAAVWTEGGVWHMLYEMYSGYAWQIGEATSSDGVRWTPYSGNPVLTYANTKVSGCGGPDVHKVGDTYHVWVTCAPSSFLPTNIYRFYSTDLHRWTKVEGNAGGAVLSRLTADEGASSGQGQVADPSLVEVEGKTYMMYSATETQNPGPGSAIHLKVAVAPMPVSELVVTAEGDGKVGP